MASGKAYRVAPEPTRFHSWGPTPSARACSGAAGPMPARWARSGGTGSSRNDGGRPDAPEPAQASRAGHGLRLMDICEHYGGSGK